MKKFIFSILFIVTLFSSIVLAADHVSVFLEEKPTAKELLIGNFRSTEFASIGGEIRISVAIENTQGEDLEDAVVSLSVPNLGLRQKGGPIDIDEGDSFEETFTFIIEDDIEPGYYTTRLIIESGGVSLVDHREVWIE